MIHMVLNVVIISPYGYFVQANALGMRDIEGKVMYISFVSLIYIP